MAIRYFSSFENPVAKLARAYPPALVSYVMSQTFPLLETMAARFANMRAAVHRTLITLRLRILQAIPLHVR